VRECWFLLMLLGGNQGRSGFDLVEVESVREAVVLQSLALWRESRLSL